MFHNYAMSFLDNIVNNIYVCACICEHIHMGFGSVCVYLCMFALCCLNVFVAKIHFVSELMLWQSATHLLLSSS